MALSTSIGWGSMISELPRGQERLAASWQSKALLSMEVRDYCSE